MKNERDSKFDHLGNEMLELEKFKCVGEDGYGNRRSRKKRIFETEACFHDASPHDSRAIARYPLS